ncbi:MAG: hypothetical protein WBZ08_18845, partial [Pseudolabrys sp.]
LQANRYWPQDLKTEFTIAGLILGKQGASCRKCHKSTRFAAHFRPSESLHWVYGNDAREELGVKMMNAKATEQKQDSAGHYTNLDNRYGKIGISAVAAAMCHKGEQRNSSDSHFEPYDRD